MDVTRAQDLGRLGVTLKPDTPHFFVRRLFVATIRVGFRPSVISSNEAREVCCTRHCTIWCRTASCLLLITNVIGCLADTALDTLTRDQVTGSAASGAGGIPWIRTIGSPGKAGRGRTRGQDPKV